MRTRRRRKLPPPAAANAPARSPDGAAPEGEREGETEERTHGGERPPVGRGGVEEEGEDARLRYGARDVQGPQMPGGTGALGRIAHDNGSDQCHVGGSCAEAGGQEHEGKVQVPQG